MGENTPFGRLTAERRVIASDWAWSMSRFRTLSSAAGQKNHFECYQRMSGSATSPPGESERTKADTSANSLRSYTVLISTDLALISGGVMVI